MRQKLTLSTTRQLGSFNMILLFVMADIDMKKIRKVVKLTSAERSKISLLKYVKIRK